MVEILAKTPTIQTLSIPAIVYDGKAVLLDRKGDTLLKYIPLARVAGPFDSALAERWLWTLAARMMLDRLKRLQLRVGRNPWLAKADTLAHSFRLRTLDITRPRGRCHFEKYPTKAWDMAIKRLWTQGQNHYRRYARNGWNRWAETVSNNYNKRKGGRYAKRNSQDDIRADSTTELSLCS